MPAIPFDDLALREAMMTKDAAKALGAPDLAQPGWYRLVGQRYHDAAKELSPEGRRIMERKQRKAAKRGPAALLAALRAA